MVASDDEGACPPRKNSVSDEDGPSRRGSIVDPSLLGRRASLVSDKVTRRGSKLWAHAMEYLVVARIAEIGQTAPHERDEQSIQTMLEWMRGIEIFDLLDEFKRSEFARYLMTAQVPKGTIVCQQGHVDNRFYVLARGKVEVYVKEGTTEKRASSAMKVVPTVSTDSLASQSELYKDVASTEHSAEPSPYGTLVRVLEDRSCFGEKGLQARKKRTATCRTQDDCVMLTLDASRFTQILASDRQRLNKSRIQILRSHSPFSSWPESLLNRVACNLQEITLDRGERVYDSSKPDQQALCFIVSGGVDVVVPADLRLHNQFCDNWRNFEKRFPGTQTNVPVQTAGQGEMVGLEALVHAGLYSSVLRVSLQEDDEEEEYAIELSGHARTGLRTCVEQMDERAKERQKEKLRAIQMRRLAAKRRERESVADGNKDAGGRSPSPTSAPAGAVPSGKGGSGGASASVAPSGGQ
eukprot:Rmarinus@m.29127